ncbi:MAG TPA: GNAT family N-acetyltransferase [Desulfobacteraceae bacterium]|nr:GNAT family N-acetyltransferase [Desulfobacteraceae bacterium]|tara:strand:+ start:138 stop:584 length:447 start_codon:yes stop_codon:yes gene_type:complete
MIIIENTPAYLDRLVPVIEEYRVYCGAPADAQGTRDFFERRLADGGAVTFIAVDEDTDAVMGFVNLYPSYSTLAQKRLWILNDLGVSGNFRGHGVARALIRKVLGFAAETGAVRVELKTRADNTGAQALYRSVGFEIDQQHVYYQVPV